MHNTRNLILMGLSVACRHACGGNVTACACVEHLGNTCNGLPILPDVCEPMAVCIHFKILLQTEEGDAEVSSLSIYNE